MDTDLKKLAKARIKAMSEEIGIIVGENKLTKEEILKNIESETETGKKIAEDQLEFLRDLAKGKIYDL